MSPLATFKVRNKLVKAAVAKPQESLGAFDPVRSLVHIPNKYRVRGGSILSHPNGDPYLLLANHHLIPGYDILLGMPFNDTVTVLRYTESINPITKMKGNPVLLDETQDVPIVREVEADVSEGQRNAQRETIYLALQVNVGDSVAGKTVKAVKRISGVFIAECA